MAIFRKKWPGALCFHSHRCPLGILQRIHPIHRIQRNRSKSQQNGPMVPHAGEQDDGSFLQRHNIFWNSSPARGSRGSPGSRGNGVRSRKPDPPKHAQESSDDVSSQQTPSNEFCIFFGPFFGHRILYFGPMDIHG